RAYQQLEEGIVTLRLKPGTLCTETELSSMLGIGRTPIREALQRLAEKRLVQNIPRHGIKITEINVADHFSRLETRRVLDRLLATKAAKRATPAQRQRFRDLAAQMETAMNKNDLITYMHVDRAFDELLEAAARNPFAAASAGVLHAHCRRFWYYYRHDGNIAEIAGLHVTLMRAVADGDESAAGHASDAIIDYMEQFTKNSLDIS
ncbi:GntR family transcriptional regulator, partial [candidate division KSB1 bacterium]|nr:GntR family transcriptional regulator [candidate division KSB1 bacterium]